MRVTERNKKKFVSLLVEHYLIGHCRSELAVVVEGFYDLVPKKVLRGPTDANPLAKVVVGCAAGGMAYPTTNAIFGTHVLTSVGTTNPHNSGCDPR